MNTSGLLQSKWSPRGFTITLQETGSIHDSTNTSGLLQSKWSPKGFMIILQETRSIHDSILNYDRINGLVRV